MKMRSKYNNEKHVIDGNKFDSKKEAQRYRELKMLEKEGIISDLYLQPRFTLQETFRKNGETFRSIVYCADFSYTRGEKKIVEDTKGMKTPEYKIKRKLFEFRFSDLTIKEL